MSDVSPSLTCVESAQNVREKGGALSPYVGLVRGINVGARNRINMVDFRAVFIDLGYHNVHTVLQSGNVVFDSALAMTAEQIAAIESKFFQVAGFSARFVILDSSAFLQSLQQNPFSQESYDPSRVLISYLSEAIEVAQLDIPEERALLPDIIHATPKAVYSWYQNGLSDSSIPASFWKQLGCVYTARNLNTVNKLAALITARLSSHNRDRHGD